ncbi:MAG: hypothetical protein KBS81_00350, partial [Spirochaetales bacterium]|nr:hypothetical protein [Candidatus Physcosoma equi]
TIGAKVGYGVRFNTLLAEGFVNFQIPNQQVHLTVGAGTFANAFAAEVGAGVNMPISENFTIFGEGSLLFSADHLMQPTAQFTVGAKYTF